MSKYENVRAAIDRLNGGEFQALASRYVRFKHHLTAGNNLGMSAGTTSTAQGTPDAYFILPNGHLLFLECGHVKDHGKAQAKLRDDVCACLKYEKKHPTAHIDIIVCCYSYGRFAAEELTDIQALDSQKRIELIGPDDIAEACCTVCPWLASEYLHISLGSGTMLDVEAYVARNAADTFAPRIDQELIGRQGEFDKLQTLLQKNQAVMVTGPSGCGKTKLALEVAKRYAAQTNMDLYVVIPSRQRLFEDLKTYLSPNHGTLLLLDDANDLAELCTVVNMALDTPRLVLLVTVRNYAKDMVEHELKRIQSHDVLNLHPLSDADRNRVLQNECGIKSVVERLRVDRITRGNLRLALLASEVMQTGVTALESLKDLLEAVYESKLKELHATQRSAIAIASLLGPHRIQSKDVHTLLGRFGLTLDEYVAACSDLYGYEFMDIVYDASSKPDAVTFAEQNLRDYSLYRTVIADGTVQLKDLWTLGEGCLKCVRVYTTLKEVFGDKHTLEELGCQLEDLLHTVSDDEQLRVVESFGAELGTSALIALDEQLTRLPTTVRTTSWSSRDIYKRFNHPDVLSRVELEAAARLLESTRYCVAAVKIIFALLRKVPITLADVHELFLIRLNMWLYAESDGYKKERAVLGELAKGGLSADGSLDAVALILFAQGLFPSQEWKGRFVNNPPWHYQKPFQYLSPIRDPEELFALRKKCMRLLLSVYNDKRWQAAIADVLFAYTEPWSDCEKLIHDTYALISEEFYPRAELVAIDQCENVAHIARTVRVHGTLATNGLRALKRNATHELAFALCDCAHFSGMPFGQEVAAEYKKTFAHALERSRALRRRDWNEFLALLDKSRQIRHLKYVDWFLAHLLHDALVGSAELKAIALGLPATRLDPTSDITRCAHECVALLLSTHGYERGRKALAASAHMGDGAHVGAWLAAYDKLACEEGRRLDLPRMLDSMASHDEVLPFSTVCQEEQRHPGFLAVYLEQLADEYGRVGKANSALGDRGYLASERDWHERFAKDREALEAVLALPHNRAALIRVACLDVAFAKLPECYEVLRALLRAEPPVFASLARAFFTRSDVGHVDFATGSVVAGLISFDDAMRSVESVLNATGCDDSGQLAMRGRHLRYALRVAERLGVPMQTLDDWVFDRAADADHPTCTVARRALVHYESADRLNMVRRLVEHGIDDQGFSQTALELGSIRAADYVGEAERWVDYYQQLEYELIEGGHFEFLSATRNAKDDLRSRIHNARITIFLCAAPTSAKPLSRQSGVRV